MIERFQSIRIPCGRRRVIEKEGGGFSSFNFESLLLLGSVDYQKQISFSRKTQKTGETDSLAIVIPRPFVRLLNLHVGERLTFFLRGNDIIIEKEKK